ncbi:hypothetical protein DEU56DRAFT_831303 [Suillus clintonianus]|uniref:uncharacterized protein n=1 Tax=Suillus clintonianus TaxID=1904413 RepID=UPI001B85BE51|nr:uncharacterized protein DEU56DRAFT_831303 [Suillus clintonianus]KAG2122781.1 hypothetical protein DEU56DRAFT_831303 [Suillus clintonianus]
MSIFPTYHNLTSPAGFPGLSSSYSAEQISLPPMEQPLCHQKSADLAALEILSEDELLSIVDLLCSSAPGAHSDYSTIMEESHSEEVQNDFTAAIRAKPPHPRVAHACDHCRRRKTKCSGEQPACSSCKKRGKVCQWTPLKTTKERRSRKPYDVDIEYRPRPRAPVPYIMAPRATYPSSVMLPNPMTIWSTENFMSAPAPIVKSTTQAPTGWSAPAQYDCQEVDINFNWIPSPPSSCPSLGSDVSSCESSLLGTPSSSNSRISSASPVEDSASDIDTFFSELYQGLSPEWTSLLNNWSDETEMFIAQ